MWISLPLSREAISGRYFRTCYKSFSPLHILVDLWKGLQVLASIFTDRSDAQYKYEVHSPTLPRVPPGFLILTREKVHLFSELLPLDPPPSEIDRCSTSVTCPFLTCWRSPVAYRDVTFCLPHLCLSCCIHILGLPVNEMAWYLIRSECANKMSALTILAPVFPFVLYFHNMPSIRERGVRFNSGRKGWPNTNILTEYEN